LSLVGIAVIKTDSAVAGPSAKKEEDSYESAEQCPADLRELQDRPPKRDRAGHLYEYEAQAEARVTEVATCQLPEFNWQPATGNWQPRSKHAAYCRR
jgi:hypothetical protein